MQKSGVFVVVDLETTGLSRYKHKITEIAAVKMKGKEIVDEFQTLINPGVKIPRFITRLTGIDDVMVKDAPAVSEVLPSFLNFLGDQVMVAHNATFDYGFISHNASEHLDVNFENFRLCTKKLANRLLPDLHSKRLGVICEHFGINNDQAHRAMSDVRATSEVFCRFLDMVGEQGISMVDELLKFERSPIKRNI